MQKTTQEQLTDLIPTFKLNKTEADSYKKLVDALGDKIKELMTQENLTEITVDGIKASCTVSDRVSFDEDALLAKLKQLSLYQVIKQREYVDMEALESAIYNGIVNAAELADCQTHKEIVTLRVK